MTWDSVQGVLRALLAAAGGFVIAKGWATDATWVTVGGAVLAVAQAIWSVIHNSQQGPAK